MKRLASRNAWRGVDAAYQSMEELAKKGVVLSYRDHYLGAEAARALGDINGTYNRLRNAVEVDPKDDATGWIQGIEATYRHLELSVEPKYKGEVALAIAEPPFAPDQRLAIERAQKQVLENRGYIGLLPYGQYTFGDQSFEINSETRGMTVTLAPAAAVREVPEREPGEGFKFLYVGPRVDLGLATTQAGEASDGGLQPGAFGGNGLRAGLGVEVGISSLLGVVAQVGYHGFGGAPSGSDDEELTELDGYLLARDGFHMGFGWLAGSLHFGDLGVAAGPVFSVGAGSVTGLNDWCAGRAQAQACSGMTDADQQELDYQRASGSIRAGGGALAVQYALFSMGGLKGGMGLTAGAQSDTARMYPWAQVGLSLSPGWR
jgi:hypothetical protein